jgi:hypothetical protein
MPGERRRRVDRSVHLARVGWWCGVVAVVLISVGFFAIDEGGSTPPDGPIEVLVREVTGNRGRIVVGSLIGMVGAVVSVWFAATLRIRLARENPVGEVLGLVGYACGIVMTVGALAHGSFRLATTTVQDPQVLAEAMRPLALLKEHVTDVLVWGAMGLVVTMSLASFLVRLLPRTMAWVGATLAALTVALTPTDHGGVGAALFPWLAVACLLLVREGDRMGAPEPT